VVSEKAVHGARILIARSCRQSQQQQQQARFSWLYITPSMLLTCHVDHMPAPEMKSGEKRSEMTNPDSGAADVIAERDGARRGEGTEEEVRVRAYAINGLKLIVPSDLSGGGRGAAGEERNEGRYSWEFTAVSCISISSSQQYIEAYIA